ncbi:MAG: DM13 domain-containing protein [Planctomycetota bacterium]
MLKKVILAALLLNQVFCATTFATCSRVGWQADLSTLFHDVDGIVTIVDEDTIQVDHFYFDGLGLSIYFYLATEDDDAAFANGLQIGTNLFGTVFSDDSMTIDLPANETIDDYNAISVWCVPVSANFGSGTFQCPGSTAQYKVTFIGNWNPTDHPDNYPANAHFSGIIGATHNCHVSFWTPYTLVSQGIEDMAEIGSKTALTNEVNAAISGGSAYSLISGGGLNPVYNNSVSTTFEANSCFPLVTLTSMVAPSPDWFVGVENLPLYENGQWRKKVVVDLYPWDAGTEEGTGFSTDNAATVPQDINRRITTAPFAQTTSSIAPLGRFVYERTDVCRYQLKGDINQDCTANFADLAELTKVWLVDCSGAPLSLETPPHGRGSRPTTMPERYSC